MNLTARETKENRNDFLKEMKLNEKIVTYIKCRVKNLNKSIYVFFRIIIARSLSFSASRFVRFAFEVDARVFWFVVEKPLW